MTVGNGEFAFSADVTGLQTFPEVYASHIPLCTLSQWGWHSFPMPASLAGVELKPHPFDSHGRAVGYFVAQRDQEALFHHLRESPHRLNLGRVALRLTTRAGRPARIDELQQIDQSLDLWTGQLVSRFEFDGNPVEVRTCCPGETDGIAVHVRSALIARGQLSIVIEFPYGSPDVAASDERQPGAHRTIAITRSEHRTDFHRMLDADEYHAALETHTPATLEAQAAHRFELRAGRTTEIAFTIAFAPLPLPPELPDTQISERLSAELWRDYWTSGGAIDLGGSTDPRADELERRIVLSQYLMRANCAGSLPPAETGLTCNSWYGKFHLEMHWWHGVHFALWGRLSLLEKSLGFYDRILPEAKRIAQRQGYAGARWPKMVDPSGRDSPSPVGPLLLWQQPHPIYYAELCYRENPTRGMLERFAEIVEQTAEFMASYAHYDEARRQYVLGPPLKTVSENTDPTTTMNPAFELVYWRFGLSVAQEWRERLGRERVAKWDDVLDQLSPLPQHDGRYLLQEGMTDTYTKWNWEHPAVVGVRGVLPGSEVDPATHCRTVEKVMQVWQWDRCWGWDFPMVAMAAARAGRGDLAIDALFLESKKNSYSLVGHNYQRPNLALYLPGNGGLLAAVAMMAAGWDGAPPSNAPGFPLDGWVVQHEGLRAMP